MDVSGHDFENMMTDISSLYKYISIPVIKLWNFIYKCVIWISNKWIEFCQSEFAQKLALNALWFWSGFCINVEQCCQQMYDANCIVKSWVDGYIYMHEQLVHIIQLFERRKREPEADHWISVCTSKTNAVDSKTIYFETYEILKNPHTEELKQSLTNAFTSICPIELDSVGLSYRDTIVIMKTLDIYRVQLCQNNSQNNSQNNNTNVDLEASSYSLLSVVYSHSQMSQQITLDIPNEMYLVGNQLLSPAFVYRALAYQNKPFVYDMNYIIHLIDNNVNQFQLTSREYLTIGENEGVVSQLQ